MSCGARCYMISDITNTEQHFFNIKYAKEIEAAKVKARSMTKDEFREWMNVGNFALENLVLKVERRKNELGLTDEDTHHNDSVLRELFEKQWVNLITKSVTIEILLAMHLPDA